MTLPDPLADPGRGIEEGGDIRRLKDKALYGTSASELQHRQLRRIQLIAPVETLQPQYSLIDRDAENELLPFAEGEGIGVIVYCRWPPACSPGG